MINTVRQSEWKKARGKQLKRGVNLTLSYIERLALLQRRFYNIVEKEMYTGIQLTNTASSSVIHK